MSSIVQRATVVATNPPAKSNQASMQLALFHADGTQVVAPKKMPAQANSTATDVAGLVTDFNALLLKLRNAGLLT